MLPFQHPIVISPVSGQGTLHVFPYCSVALLTLEILLEFCMSAFSFIWDFFRVHRTHCFIVISRALEKLLFSFVDLCLGCVEFFVR